MRHRAPRGSRRASCPAAPARSRSLLARAPVRGHARPVGRLLPGRGGRRRRRHRGRRLTRFRRAWYPLEGAACPFFHNTPAREADMTGNRLVVSLRAGAITWRAWSWARSCWACPPGRGGRGRGRREPHRDQLDARRSAHQLPAPPGRPLQAHVPAAPRRARRAGPRRSSSSWRRRRRPARRPSGSSARWRSGSAPRRRRPRRSASARSGRPAELRERLSAEARQEATRLVEAAQAQVSAGGAARPHRAPGRGGNARDPDRRAPHPQEPHRRGPPAARAGGPDADRAGVKQNAAVARRYARALHALASEARRAERRGGRARRVRAAPRRPSRSSARPCSGPG